MGSNLHIYKTSISANAGGPRDAASLKIDHIALPPSIITRQRASVDSKLLHRPRMSVISTYLKDNAQILLGRFVVVDILYNQVCNKYNDKSN